MLSCVVRILCGFLGEQHPHHIWTVLSPDRFPIPHDFWATLKIERSWSIPRVNSWAVDRYALSSYVDCFSESPALRRGTFMFHCLIGGNRCNPSHSIEAGFGMQIQQGYSEQSGHDADYSPQYWGWPAYARLTAPKIWRFSFRINISWHK
jgi:hypothetical protein